MALGSAIAVMTSMKTSLPTVVPDQNSDKLGQRIEEMVELSDRGDYEKIYDFYFTNEAKQEISRELYLKLNDKPNAFLFEKGSEILKDDKGYAIKYSLDKKEGKYLRHYAEFLYIDNDWFYNYSLNNKYCIRDAGYEMPEEFKRAISLITQRLKQSSNKRDSLFGRDIEGITNCLNVQYANSEKEMSGAEGLFFYNPSQSLEKLDILVSPKYSAKDDLLTAILLVHEITHAIDNNTNREFLFISYDPKAIKPGDAVSAKKVRTYSGCYALEANAFLHQNYFVETLNKEEVSSLVARAQTGGSAEVYGAFLTYMEIPKFMGDFDFEKAINFVKSNPYYQKQCKDE